MQSVEMIQSKSKACSIYYVLTNWCDIVGLGYVITQSQYHLVTMSSHY